MTPWVIVTVTLTVAFCLEASLTTMAHVPEATAVTVTVADGPVALDGDAVALPLHALASTVKLPE